MTDFVWPPGSTVIPPATNVQALTSIILLLPTTLPATPNQLWLNGSGGTNGAVVCTS